MQPEKLIAHQLAQHFKSADHGAMVMITQEYLKELLSYDIDTGVFTWLPRNLLTSQEAWCVASWNTKHAGKIAGSVTGRGYIDLRIFYKSYRAHRLAWLYVYGEFPKLGIDHIDGDFVNNRISNLRDVSQAENNKNAKRPKSNTSGVSGVSFEKHTNKWRAYIAGKSIGRYSDMAAAILARNKAEKEFGFHKNHGRADALLIAKFG